jgi:lysophospholipase L1-like esterase
MRSKAVLWTTMLAVPVLLLGAAELILRAAGYGAAVEPLFVPSPAQAGYLQANPKAVTRLFADPAQAPAVSIETVYFRANKRPGALRVFVQGESSAAGFPYGLGASLAGVLDQRLKRAYPTREIEVVSTAMSAVNTYALLDFADEIIAHAPDVVVIYVGHNEYLGILGVGSSFRGAASPRVTRAALALRDVRLYQAIGAIARKLVPKPPAISANASDTLMAQVAAEREIAFGSAMYRAGLDQFDHNLRKLLARYQAARIPVFVGTLVSNERDQPPFVSLASEGEQSARGYFDKGRAFETSRDYRAANAAYGAARDRDALRFRAPAAFNAAIRAAASTHGASLVDVEARLRGASPEGMLGASLLLEHVHPNLEGYFLLADAFFDEIIQSGLAGVPVAVIPNETARLEMPVSAVDKWLGEYKLLKIRSAWPFVSESRPPALPPAQTPGEQLALRVYQGALAWPEAQDQLRAVYRLEGNTIEYARVSTILADAFPFIASLQLETADALAALARTADALRYARRALESEPQNALAIDRIRRFETALARGGGA